MLSVDLRGIHDDGPCLEAAVLFYGFLFYIVSYQRSQWVRSFIIVVVAVVAQRRVFGCNVKVEEIK